MIVIVGKYSGVHNLRSNLNTIVIDDRNLYYYLNGETRINKTKYTNDPEGLINALISKERESGKKIILHTFNTSILNYFSNEYAIENFYFIDQTDTLSILFSSYEMMNKLLVSKPGDVVANFVYKRGY